MYQVSSNETRPVHNSVELYKFVHFKVSLTGPARQQPTIPATSFFGAFLPSQSQVPSSRKSSWAATRNKEHETCARDESYSSKITLHFPLSKKLDAPKSYISSPTHFLGVTTLYILVFVCMYVCLCVYINKTLGGKKCNEIGECMRWLLYEKMSVYVLTPHDQVWLKWFVYFFFLFWWPKCALWIHTQPDTTDGCSQIHFSRSS